MTSGLIAQGFKLVKAAQLAAVTLAAVLAWGLAAALGQGVAPLSKVSACLVVGERRDVPMHDVALQSVTTASFSDADDATPCSQQSSASCSPKATARAVAAPTVPYRLHSVHRQTNMIEAVRSVGEKFLCRGLQSSACRHGSVRCSMAGPAAPGTRLHLCGVEPCPQRLRHHPFPVPGTADFAFTLIDGANGALRDQYAYIGGPVLARPGMASMADYSHNKVKDPGVKL